MFEAFLAKLLCIILNISSAADNLYICYNLGVTHNGNSCAYVGFCAHNKSLYDCASTKSMFTIAKSIAIVNSSYKFGSFPPNLLQVNTIPACPHQKVWVQALFNLPREKRDARFTQHSLFSILRLTLCLWLWLVKVLASASIVQSLRWALFMIPTYYR